MNVDLSLWASRWGLPQECLADLVRVLCSPAAVLERGVPGGAGKSEAWAQNAVRLEGARRGARLWRNNRGAVTTEDGRHIRYGLANDSAAMNKKIKSHDLVGVTPLTITPGHVGRTVGVFTSVEVKRPGWEFKPNDPHERAQLAWLHLVVALGGFATFAAGPHDLDKLIPDSN